jgi:phospholipase/carboxylesterase
MLEQLETPAIGNKQPTGFLHRPAERKRGEYSLYVPENYDASWEWPLIVCLHGGMGRGGDYIWTWLRPAKSKGYFLLSPKSLGPTWSLIGEDYDRESVLAMMGEVRSQYRIDNRKILLTGLSDGGSYGLTLGLNHPEHFSGLASIAGVLQTDADPQQVGNLSILIVHGRQDYIFPVGMARTAYAHLQQQGLRVTYQELPDWGHAFPYTIHARIVLPWFEEKIR